MVATYHSDYTATYHIFSYNVKVIFEKVVYMGNIFHGVWENSHVQFCSGITLLVIIQH